MSDEPKAILEARDLLDAFYGFTSEDEQARYGMADDFRDDAVRLVVLNLHLSCEELLRALTYNALRLSLAGPFTFTEKQDIAYVQDLRTAQAIDLAARLRIIGKRTHQRLTELNRLRNEMSHNWLLSGYPPGHKKAAKEGHPPRAPLDWKGKLLTPARCKSEFMSTFGTLYLDLWMAYAGDEKAANRLKR
jgi:hypothetical protein